METKKYQIPAEMLEVLNALGTISDKVRRYNEEATSSLCSEMVANGECERSAAVGAMNETEWVRKVSMHLDDAITTILDKVREQMEDAVYSGVEL